MIFYLTAGILAAAGLYLSWQRWSHRLAKVLFMLSIFLLVMLMLIAALGINFPTMQSQSMRRTIVVLADISASMGIKLDKKEEFETRYKQYDLDVLPFSDKLQGLKDEQNTGIVDSLHAARSYIQQRYQDDEIAGVILVTDGNETIKIDKMHDYNALKLGDFPHNALYINEQGENDFFDKSVSFLQVPRYFPRFEKVNISFMAQAIGSNLNAIPVELRLDGKPIGTVLVELKQGYGVGSFELIIKDTGLSLLEAHIAVDSRELNTANNQDFATVEGILDSYRVLHLSGHPSMDTSFVRRGLQNIPGVDMISFFILRKQQQAFMAANHELSLIPFPTDQLFSHELDNFDVIIINDFKLSEFLSPLYIENIAKFVESGGGLFILGGQDSFSPQDYGFSFFQSIMPLTLAAQNHYQEMSFSMRSDLSLAMTSLRSLWPGDKAQDIRLKGLNTVNVKPQGNVFLSTDQGQPLLVGGFAKEGRVLAMLSDGMWRFAYNGSMRNEVIIRSAMRYLLGISTMPVRIINNQIRFSPRLERMQKDSSIKDYHATVSYETASGRQKIAFDMGQKKDVPENADKKLDVIIYNKDAIVDRYRLLNYEEQKGNEFSFLPLGALFLQQWTKSGGGNLLNAKKIVMPSSLSQLLPDEDKLNLREPTIIIDKQSAQKAIYYQPWFLLLLMFITIGSYYLKSRFCSPVSN